MARFCKFFWWSNIWCCKWKYLRTVRTIWFFLTGSRRAVNSVRHWQWTTLKLIRKRLAAPHPSLVVKHFPSTAALVVSPDTDTEVPASPSEVLTTVLCKGVPIRRKEGRAKFSWIFCGKASERKYHFYSGCLILSSWKCSFSIAVLMTPQSTT